MSEIRIIVATHKPYWMPSDDMYLPLHVGRAGKADIGFAGDDTGDNISEKNPYYSELTGLYWAWKNLDADYIGLAHYRRHFSLRQTKDPKQSVLTRAQLEPLLRETDLILPRKRRYYIETVYSHYSHTFDGAQLDLAREIIAEKCPEYLTSFDRVMKARSIHIYNMFIMRRELLDKYCAWLFDILFEMERRIDTTRLSPFEARLFGRVSERLLNVWVMQNRIPYRTIGCISMEPVHWRNKISGFLRAKFLKEKYTASW